MKRSLVYIISVVLATVSCINEKTEGADLAAGDLIPDFTVTVNDGTELTGAMLRETPSCIMFFHTSCPDCRQALPVMQKIYDEYASIGVRFALISREEESDTIAAFWKEHGLTMPYSAQKTRKIYNLFAQTRVPRIYVCEKGGTIRFIHTDAPIPGFEDLDKEISCICGTCKE